MSSLVLNARLVWSGPVPDHVYTPWAVERVDAVEPASIRLRAADADLARTRDDARLIGAIARGETLALEEVYDRYSRAVYALAARMLGDHGSAEDVTQETFVKLWRQPHAYQPARGKLQPWLLGVAHHRAIDLLRRRRLEQTRRVSSDITTTAGDNPAEELVEEAPERDPQLTLGATEDQRTVFEALAELPRDQRVALELAYYRGYTQVEIAERLNKPLGTIKTRMRLALLRLRAAPGIQDLWRDR